MPAKIADMGHPHIQGSLVVDDDSDMLARAEDDRPYSPIDTRGFLLGVICFEKSTKVSLSLFALTEFTIRMICSRVLQTMNGVLGS